MCLLPGFEVPGSLDEFGVWYAEPLLLGNFKKFATSRHNRKGLRRP
jgi:hypothetical protein